MVKKRFKTAPERKRYRELMRAADHKDPKRRAAALEALWSHPCEGTLSVLLNALHRDPDHRAQAAAAQALGRYVWSGMQMDESLDEKFGVFDDVTHANVLNVVRNLTEVWQDTTRDMSVRYAAFDALAWDPPEPILEAIEQLWKGVGLEGRRHALRAMGRSGRPEYRPRIRQVIVDRDPDLILHALEAACLNAGDELEDELLAMTEDAEAEILGAALIALGSAGYSERTRKHLRNMRRHEDPVVREAANQALAEFEAMDGPIPTMSKTVG